MDGDPANLSSLVDGADTESGIEGGATLLAFVEAVVSGNDSDVSAARTAVVDALGEAAMIDSAAVIANFQRMVRIADSTGIPLDEPVLMMTQGIRADLGIDKFSAATNSPPLGVLKRLLGRMLGPFAPRILQRMARKRATPS